VFVQIKNIKADRMFRLLIVVILFGFISACARPIGDFGRAKPSVVHDEILPQIGKLRAKWQGEAQSNLNFTDEENEMYDRVWRFLVSAHTKDWFYDVVIEWQRTRLITPVDDKFSYNRYYSHLRSEKYTSSKVRYFKLVSDIDADINTVPGVFNSICKTIEIDRRRSVAVNSIRGVSGVERTSVKERKLENDLFINWFVRAMDYRYKSYSLALDRLLIETPHAGARDVDRRLSEFAIDVERAQRGDFCGSSLIYSKKASQNILPSRFENNSFVFGVNNENEPSILK